MGYEADLELTLDCIDLLDQVERALAEFAAPVLVADVCEMRRRLVEDVYDPPLTLYKGGKVFMVVRSDDR